jgi:hypothetical protein
MFKLLSVASGELSLREFSRIDLALDCVAMLWARVGVRSVALAECVNGGESLILRMCKRG